MARTLAAQEASEQNRPTAKLALFWVAMVAWFRGMAAQMADSTVMVDARAQAAGMQANIRRRMGRNDEGSAAITGIIELLVGFIVLVFAVLLGLLLMPLVNNQAAQLTSDPNTTAQQKSVIPIIGLVLIVALVIMALAFLFAGFKTIIAEFR